MEVRFEDPLLERLEADPAHVGGFDGALVRAYRMRVQVIRAAPDDRAFHALKFLRYEKLQGDSPSQRTMRLDDRWRLMLRLEDNDARKQVVIVSITDNHRISRGMP
jgi:proteic killer suppression protein